MLIDQTVLKLPFPVDNQKNWAMAPYTPSYKAHSLVPLTFAAFTASFRLGKAFANTENLIRPLIRRWS